MASAFAGASAQAVVADLLHGVLLGRLRDHARGHMAVPQLPDRSGGKACGSVAGDRTDLAVHRQSDIAKTRIMAFVDLRDIGGVQFGGRYRSDPRFHRIEFRFSASVAAGRAKGRGAGNGNADAGADGLRACGTWPEGERGSLPIYESAGRQGRSGSALWGCLCDRHSVGRL